MSHAAASATPLRNGGAGMPDPRASAGSRGLSTASRAARGRLLWRGALVLQDGSQLPGVSLVTTSMPLASPLAAGRTPSRRKQSASSRLPSARLLDDESQALANDKDDDDDDDDDSALDSHVIQDPAVEAEFCLGLEMVRHRPLRVLAVEQDRGPRVSEDRGTAVHWQHSRSMRMYIDPQAHRTIDFFQRKFCLDATLAPAARHARNIVLISLEPSQALTTPSKPAGTFVMPGASSISSSAQELAIFAVPSQVSSLAGLMKPEGQDTLPALELVLGRKLVAKARTRKMQTQGSFAASQFQALDRLPPRPDDPLPRTGVTQLQARSGWPLKAGRGDDLSLLSSRSLTKASSAPSLEYREPESIRQPSLRGGVTPGRRGEKRPQRPHLPTSPSGAKRARVEKRRADVIEMPLREQAENRALHGRAGPGAADDLPPLGDDMDPVLTKTLVSPLAPRGGLIGRPSSRLVADTARDRDSVSAPDDSLSQAVPSEPHVAGEPSELATANKNTVRKLVHHQLLGRGLDKHDEDYIACFSPACAAVLAALRYSLDQRPLDRRLAAATAERILSLILPGQIDPDIITQRRLA